MSVHTSVEIFIHKKVLKTVDDIQMPNNYTNSMIPTRLNFLINFSHNPRKIHVKSNVSS